MCFWLCPSLPINLDLDAGSDVHRLVEANDWITIDGALLVRRCSRGELDEEKAQALGSALQIVTDARDRPIGRIALASEHGRGALVSGGLRVAGGSHFAGVLEASGIDAARSRGYAELERRKVAAWVTDQAPRVAEHAWPVLQPALAELVLSLGGDPGPLKIAMVGGWMLSLDEASEWARTQDEVVIVDAASALSRYGNEAGFGSYSHSASEEVLDVPTHQDHLDEIVLVGDESSDSQSGFARVAQAVMEALTVDENPPTIVTETRSVGSVTAPPHPIPGIDTQTHDVEAECTVIRRRRGHGDVIADTGNINGEPEEGSEPPD